MKKFIFINLFIASLITIFACTFSEGKNNNTKLTNSTNKNVTENTILVYYFHGSIRCHTCVSVDKNTEEYLKELFPIRMDKGEIIFKSIDIDKGEKPDLVKKYQIYGQTMLFIKGNTVIDETDNAFKYVTTNPDKWKQIIENKIFDLID